MRVSHAVSYCYVGRHFKDYLNRICQFIEETGANII